MHKSRLPEIAAELDSRIDRILLSVASAVELRAKARVPVETGRLQRAIHVERTGQHEYMVIAGDHDAFYGHIVEHGGRNHSAHPFLVPALEESRSTVNDLARVMLRDL